MQWLGRSAVLAMAVVCAPGIGTVYADDAPVVRVNADGLVPRKLEVHVGEMVRWEAPAGESVRVELDRHPEAHEVREGTGDIQAIFLRTGLHTYAVTLMPTNRTFRGAVVVREARGDWERALDCASGSSDRICFTR